MKTISGHAEQILRAMKEVDRCQLAHSIAAAHADRAGRRWIQTGEDLKKATQALRRLQPTPQ